MIFLGTLNAEWRVVHWTKQMEWPRLLSTRSIDEIQNSHIAVKFDAVQRLRPDTRATPDGRERPTRDGLK